MKTKLFKYQGQRLKHIKLENLNVYVFVIILDAVRGALAKETLYARDFALVNEDKVSLHLKGLSTNGCKDVSALTSAVIITCICEKNSSVFVQRSHYFYDFVWNLILARNQSAMSETMPLFLHENPGVTNAPCL